MTKNLILSEQKARELYPSAAPEWKEILHESFGKEFFSKKITERVKDFNDILSVKGITLDQLISKTDSPDEAAYKQIKLIAEVYNEGTILDPNNDKQYKYYPWFTVTPGSGFGLSFHVFDVWYSCSHVGVRLCFKSAELAIDAGKKFTAIYAQFLIK